MEAEALENLTLSDSVPVSSVAPVSFGGPGLFLWSPKNMFRNGAVSGVARFLIRSLSGHSGSNPATQEVARYHGSEAHPDLRGQQGECGQPWRAWREWDSRHISGKGWSDCGHQRATTGGSAPPSWDGTGHALTARRQPIE